MGNAMQKSLGKGARPIFVVSILCAAVSCVCTFLKVIGVPPVGKGFGAAFLQIPPYVAQLNDQFGRWLPEMMQDPAGSIMSFLLGVGSPALYVIEALVIVAIPVFVAYAILFVKGKRKAARITGVAGFVFSGIAPLVLFVAQLIVNGQFSCGPFEPAAILSVLPVGYVWLIAAVLGAVLAVRATKPEKALKQRSE